MINNTLPAVDTKFSKEVIYQQLERIFLDPVFIKSDVLRKFLSFIVDQTLTDRANCLKEYTIAVHVLNKPSNFKPQEDSIVRNHAARLRRALNNYYHERGALDPVYISVPVGSYVPVFGESENKTMTHVLKDGDKIHIRSDEIQIDKSAVVAVIPFWHLQNDQLENLLTDGLGMQLSSALMEFEKFSVISYYTMRHLCEKITDIATIASRVGAKYIVTGNIQSQKNCFRVHIQMIHTNTNQQLLSRMYEEKFVAQNIFELQDEIVRCFISDLNESRRLIEKKVKTISMVAVA
jgi:TolB-like protein